MSPESSTPTAQPPIPDDDPTLVRDPVEPPEDDPTLGMHPPPPPTVDDTDEELKNSLRIQVVEGSQGVVAKSVDRADAHLAEQTSQGGFKGFVKKIWYGNIARDYVRQRHIQHNREELSRGNIYALEGGSQADHDRETKAVVTRFTEGYLESGERQDRLENVAGGEQLERELRTLVNFYAQDLIDDDSLEEEKTHILERFKQDLHKNDRNKGLLLADNVLEVAQAAKAAFKHGVGSAQIAAALTANLGEARIGARTEVRRELSDKIIDKLYQTRFGSVINETTLGIASAIALSIAKLTTRKAITAAAAVGGMGIGAGVMAGARAHARAGQERQQHLRERATGGEMPAEQAKRRQRFEVTRYETVAATALTDRLTAARVAVDAANPTSLHDAVLIIGEAETRLERSAQQSIDLIDFSKNTTVEQERLGLNLALAATKEAARRILGGDFDSQLHSAKEGLQTLLNQDISTKDAAFSKLRRNETLKMAAIGSLGGVALGAAIQEIRAAIGSDFQGVFEGQDSHDNRRTLLSAIVSGHAAHTAHEQAATLTTYTGHIHDTKVGEHGLAGLPTGYHMAKNGSGQWEVVGANGQILAYHLMFGPNGHLGDSSSEALEKAGFHINSRVDAYISHHVVHEQIEHSPDSYLQRHPSEFTRVNRQLWYDNNTPAFDQNELRLDWGANGTGIDAHGNLVFNVQHMTPDGSFHDGVSANAQQLIHDHKMAIALSMTRGTQAHVVMVPVNEQGQAIINAKSWMAHSLFEKSGGQAHFIGAYAEAVQLLGHHQGGETVRMLATVVGDNQPKVIHETLTHIIPEHHERFITHLIPPEHLPQPAEIPVIPIEIPPVVPIYGRRGLESLAPATRERRDYFGYQGEPSSEQRRRWERDLSPRLQDNPDAVLDPDEELTWYKKHLAERRGAEYLEDIDRRISEDEVLSSIDDSVDAIVSIPVAAASEADNIYNTLSLYNQQSDNSKHRTIILLNVNWPQAFESEPVKKAAIERTIAEIDRAKTDFPDLKIASFHKQWSDEVLSEQGVIYGEVVKVLYDTAMLSVLKAINEGRRSNKEALLITNDADAVGLRKNYLDLYLKAINDYPESDAYTGLIRFDTRTHGDYPGFGLSTNIMMLFSMASGRTGKGYDSSPGTPGANSAFRMSSFAAVGGCDDAPDVGAGADTILGWKLRNARDVPNVSSGVAYGGRQSIPTSLGAGRTATGAGRAVVKHLYAAQLDTNADRFLGVYRQGLLVGSSWNRFDEGEGAYRDRQEELKGLTDNDQEDAINDIDAIATRVEAEISFLGTKWHPQPGLISWALGTYFGTTDNDNNPLYTLNWDKGNFRFKFTDPGKQWLRNRLTRDTRGRYDPYGVRKRRQLYGEISRRAARSAPSPRFVSAPVS